MCIRDRVEVTTAQQVSNSISAQETTFSPAFFTFTGNYVAALHADYSLVGAPNLLSGVTTTAGEDMTSSMRVSFEALPSRMTLRA